MALQVGCACSGKQLCFKHKLDYWRTSGHNPFATQPEEYFKGPTQMQLERETIEAAKASGREIARADSVWV